MTEQRHEPTGTLKQRLLGSNLSILTSTSMIATFGNGLWTFLMPLYLLIIGVPVILIGITYTIIAASSSFSPVLGGSLADKIGRKPVMLLTQLIAVPLLLVMGLFSRYPYAVAIALIAWRFSGTMGAPARMTLIAESSGKRSKEHAYATWRALTDTVTISSPLIGGLLLYGGYFSLAFLLAALLNSIAFVIRLKYLEETKHTQRSKITVFRTIKMGLKDLTSNRLIITLTSVSVVSLFLSGMVEYLVPIFSTEILNIGSGYIGLLFSIQVAITAVVLKPGAILSEKLGRINLILIGVTIASIFEILFSMSFNVLIALIFFGIWMAFDIMTHPALSAFEYDTVTGERSSTDLGSMSTLASLVSIAAPATGMLLYLSMPRSPFFISAILVFLVYLILWIVAKDSKGQTSSLAQPD